MNSIEINFDLLIVSCYTVLPVFLDLPFDLNLLVLFEQPSLYDLFLFYYLLDLRLDFLVLSSVNDDLILIFLYEYAVVACLEPMYAYYFVVIKVYDLDARIVLHYIRVGRRGKRVLPQVVIDVAIF